MATILIVDDQPNLQELLSQELMDEGHRVKSVTNAETAKGYIRDARPDLVLLDLYLNGFDGWDVLRDIKNRHPSLPVLIVTAYDSCVHDPRVSEADGYVIKSFMALGGLKKMISEVLERNFL